MAVLLRRGRIRQNEVRRMRKFVQFVAFSTALLIVGVAWAAELSLQPLLGGHDEREDGAAGCLQETAFSVGAPSSELNLKVGGEAAGCDSEWAAYFEFDLSGVPPTEELYNATLVVHKTGYSDDSQGFAYIGAFHYLATGAGVLVPRDDLNPQTALDIVYPSAVNGDLSFDVTSIIQDWIAAGTDRAGLLLAGVYSEAGYEDWISVGGPGSSGSPSLEIQYQGTVDTESTSWSAIKADFH